MASPSPPTRFLLAAPSPPPSPPFAPLSKLLAVAPPPSTAKAATDLDWVTVGISVACASAALASALAAVPWSRRTRLFQREFLVLWPARVCLSLCAALLMASQPLALDLPARKMTSSSPSSAASRLMSWAAAGGACRLHSTLALGCALPMLLFTAASILAAPLSLSAACPSPAAAAAALGGDGRSPDSKRQQQKKKSLSAAKTLALAALLSAPAAAAQAALAWAPAVPVVRGPNDPSSPSFGPQQTRHPHRHRHHGWKAAALGICEPGTGGDVASLSPCGCRYSLAQLAALALTAAVGSLCLARAAGGAASASMNSRLASRLRVVQGAGSLLFLVYAALAAATRLSPPDRWPTEVARGATAAAAAAACGVLVFCLVLAPVAAASRARRADERRKACLSTVEGGGGGGGGGGAVAVVSVARG